MGGVFIVQSFARSKKGGIIPNDQIQTASQQQAVRMASRASAEAGFAVAWINISDETYLVAAAGDVPDEFLELPRYVPEGVR